MARFNSIVREVGGVYFPPFMGVRFHMLPLEVIPHSVGGGFREFKYEDQRLASWLPTIAAMMKNVYPEYDGTVYVMVDQAEVPAGSYHRRKGLHIDGYWQPARQTWNCRSAHGTHSGHRRYRDDVRKNELGAHGTGGGSHSSIVDEDKRKRRLKPNARWEDAAFEQPEAIILASDVTGSTGFFDGTFEGPIRAGGDCRQVANLVGEPVINRANVAYEGNVTMLHQTLPMLTDVQRTVVRLSVPGYSPTRH
jgi:hypothetical protein